MLYWPNYFCGVYVSIWKAAFFKKMMEPFKCIKWFLIITYSFKCKVKMKLQISEFLVFLVTQTFVKQKRWGWHRLSSKSRKVGVLFYNWETGERWVPRSLTLQLLAHNIPQTIKMLYQDQFHSIWSSTIYQVKCGLSMKGIHFSWSHPEKQRWFKIHHSACWCSASPLKTLS